MIDHGFKEFGPRSPYSFFSANLLLTLDTRVVNNSHEALLTGSDTPYVAVTTSYGEGDDKGDEDDYAGPCINVGEAERNKTDVVWGLSDLTACFTVHAIHM